MKTDLPGRLRNLRLPHSRALVPLFEAIVNSLQAIEETQERAGKIVVEVLRGGQQSLQLDEADPIKGPISGFCIRDDGVGFTEDNFDSFCTCDSTYKSKIGGRGVGRLTWLKAFDVVHVDSVFQAADGSIQERKFTFRPDDIVNGDATQPTDRPRQTSVLLDGFHENYAKGAPKKASTIAQRIVEHCMLAFRTAGDGVSLHLVDGDEEIDLGQQIRGALATAATDTVEVNGEEIRLTHLRTTAPEANHRLMFLANGREVTGEQLGSHIPHLRGKLEDADGNGFWWMTLVEGDALDGAVNAERDDFTFPTEPSPLFPNELSMKALREAVLPVIRKRLESYVAPIRKRVVEQVEDYVNYKAPEYRHVVQLRPDAVAEIPPDLPDEKLDAKLHEIAYSLQVDVRERNRELLAQATGVDSTKFDEFLTEANAVGKASLARYVVHRRLILEFLKRALERKEDGKYQLEETIHRLIFPLQKTSDEVPYSEQNLWVIDERLAYHAYLASDKQLSTLPTIDTDSKQRPDLVIFNRPFAFSEQSPYGTIVLVEFKRPARDDYDDRENPLDQVYDYISRIREGIIKDRAGRPLNVPPQTPFHCYIICDITPSLMVRAANAMLTRSPDGRGYFGFNPNHAAYIEIISFDKLLDDAVKRNRMLFEKLGIPAG